MSKDELLPRAREGGLLEEKVGEELLLYDRESHVAHCLSRLAATVWQHCDGARDVGELAELVLASKTEVVDVLRELWGRGLLEGEPSVLMQSTVSGVSRREAISRIGRVGAAAASVPLIVSATAATPAMAASGAHVCGTKEEPNTSCCLCESGLCLTDSPEWTPARCKEECEHFTSTKVADFKNKRACT